MAILERHIHTLRNLEDCWERERALKRAEDRQVEIGPDRGASDER
jgi:hypothetical protein